jgi:uncharacterized membrane protein YgdD (TMEM256/DUF423 family)
MEFKIIRWAAILGMLAVILGAFGAHALKEILIQNGTNETYKTAVFYHLTHTLAILFLASQSIKSKPIILQLWVLGIILFSGSLYIISVFQLKFIGIITPIGGALLIAGWLMLMVKAKDR